MELIHKRLGLVALVALAGLFLAGGAKAIAADEKHIEFDMVRSATAVGAGCLPDAIAR